MSSLKNKNEPITSSMKHKKSSCEGPFKNENEAITKQMNMSQ
jgi:hypothetical protein